MDINDIQNLWDSDKNENIQLPTNLQKIQLANTPLAKIKRNLKREFYCQVISLPAIGFVPLLSTFPKTAIAPFYLLFSLFFAINFYYTVKLYIFYKKLNKTSLSTKDSLYETYFDIRLNMELYKTFGIALTPFLILSLLGFIYYNSPDIFFKGLNNNKFLTVTFSVVTYSMLYMGLVMELWVNYYYGKHLKEIKKVIDELKED
jgi:hypothetical protein